MVQSSRATSSTVRPIIGNGGDHEFNEVFFTDVFIPDDDVVITDSSPTPPRSSRKGKRAAKLAKPKPRDITIDHNTVLHDGPADQALSHPVDSVRARSGRLGLRRVRRDDL